MKDNFQNFEIVPNVNFVLQVLTVTGNVKKEVVSLSVEGVVDRSYWHLIHVINMKLFIVGINSI